MFAKQDAFADIVDPHETAHNEMSHQDLHCLPSCLVFMISLFSIMEMSKVRDRDIFCFSKLFVNVTENVFCFINLFVTLIGVASSCKPFVIHTGDVFNKLFVTHTADVFCFN